MLLEEMVVKNVVMLGQEDEHAEEGAVLMMDCGAEHGGVNYPEEEEEEERRGRGVLSTFAAAAAAGFGSSIRTSSKTASSWKYISSAVVVVVVVFVAAATTTAGWGHGESQKQQQQRRTVVRDLQTTPDVNGTRRSLQDVVVDINGTEGGRRYLQEDVVVNGTARRYLQEDVVVNGTAGGIRRNRYLLVEDDDGEEGEGEEVALSVLFPATIDLKLPSPCRRVDVGMPNAPEWRARCQEYLNQPYIVPDCTDQPERVPRIYHSVSRDATQAYHQLATTAQNPTFVRNHLSDTEAADFVLDHCGPEAYQAYQCFAPPAYRADLFRFCALTALGGVYLDEDMVPFVPLEELYSPCASATVGHDFPWKDKPGKQMKILAAAPGAPLFQCALERIIEHVRTRAYPETELELTGPQLLHQCYADVVEEDVVAVLYHDTRNAEWPFTGMRKGQSIVAYELPMSQKHFWLEGGKDTEDYTDLFQARKVYKETCELH